MQNHREHAAHSVVETFAVCLMSGLGVLHGSSTQRKIQLHAARMIFAHRYCHRLDLDALYRHSHSNVTWDLRQRAKEKLIFILLFQAMFFFGRNAPLIMWFYNIADWVRTEDYTKCAQQQLNEVSMKRTMWNRQTEQMKCIVDTNMSSINVACDILIQRETNSMCLVVWRK